MVASVSQLAPPSKKEAEIARRSGQRLAQVAKGGKALTLQVRDQAHAEPIELPAGAVRLLLAILEDMASGQAVALVPHNAELTTQQAAEVLNVSRPFVVKLIAEKKLPVRMVGSHRRIRFEDVMNYKAAVDTERRKALDELAAEAQELGLGY